MATPNLHLNKTKTKTKTKTVTIVSPTFNEEENISFFLDTLINERKKISNYDVDILIIDNASEDKTQQILKKYAKKFKFLKIIINNRNFGHIRSPYWGIIQSRSDATIYLASDFQDPPYLIHNFIKEWEKGYKVVLGIKNSVVDNSFIVKIFKNLFYWLIQKTSSVQQIKNSTGFGLYDRTVIETVININDPYPYLRGLIAELGYEVKKVFFDQPIRSKGKSKNNIFSLYDIGILGLISHSTTILRISSLLGFIFGAVSFFVAIYYLICKLLFWEEFILGIAPLVVFGGLMLGLILFFIGIIGEYLIVIHRYVKNQPVVVEKERINF
jgi:glycosyltransferase involved in cell wall biosynthesis